MGVTFPFSNAMRVIGGMLLLSVIVNALITLRTNWGSDWYFAWSPLFLFVGLLLLTASTWGDPRFVLGVSGVLAVLWYVFIVLGWSF